MTTAPTTPVTAAAESAGVGFWTFARVRYRGLAGRVGEWMAIGRLVGFAPDWAA